MTKTDKTPETPETPTETVFIIDGKEIRPVATKEETLSFVMEAVAKLDLLKPGCEEEFRATIEAEYDLRIVCDCPTCSGLDAPGIASGMVGRMIDAAYGEGPTMRSLGMRIMVVDTLLKGASKLSSSQEL